MNYQDYLEAYKFNKGAILHDEQSIKTFIQYWENNNIPPHLWYNWIKEHEEQFSECGLRHDPLHKELKKFTFFSRKRYLESQQTTQNTNTNIFQKIRGVIHL